METGTLQTILNQNNSHQNKTTQLRPGQIVNGRIVKLFPDGIAEVQIGSQKMVAQLEAPLTANDRYWFQVQPGLGKVHLKVMASGGEEGKQLDGIAKILGTYSMPVSKENVELIRFFIKEQLPVSKDALLMASEWLKTADSPNAGMEAVKMLLAKGLPLSTAVYSALYTANNEPSIPALMVQLSARLNEADATESSIKINELLNEQKPNAGGFLLGKLLESWLNGTNKKEIPFFSILKQVKAFPAQSDEKGALHQLYSAFQKKPETSSPLPGSLETVQRILNQMEQGNSSEATKLVKLLGAQFHEGSTAQLQGLTELLGEMAEKKMDDDSKLAVVKQLLSFVSAKDMDGELLEKGFKALFGKSAFMIVSNQLDLVREAGPDELKKIFGLNMRQAEHLAVLFQTETVDQVDSPFFLAGSIKRFLSSLGLSYEQELNDRFSSMPSDKKINANALKPLLMRLLNEQHPQPIKETAEQLLNKITGFQLLSQETGPVQQLIAQLPIYYGDKMLDVTVQWSGQKKKDGTIDADFCRVLFYLNLEHLDDTIIDMQVQNRIMSIHVLNENQTLKQYSSELIPLLKEKLSKLEYHLSSVSFSSTASREGGQGKRVADLYKKKEYSGVDIRI